MTDKTDLTNNKATETIPTSDPIGSVLKNARITLKLSVSDIASSLRISTEIIEHIENNAISEIDFDVYIKGYIKSYAKLVEVPIDILLPKLNKIKEHEYNQTINVANSDIYASQSIVRLNKKKSKFFTGPLVYGLLLLGLCFFILSLSFKTQNNNRKIHHIELSKLKHYQHPINIKKPLKKNLTQELLAVNHSQSILQETSKTIEPLKSEIKSSVQDPINKNYSSEDSNQNTNQDINEGSEFE
jgi:cytoskeletal protein RodZ